VIENRPNAVDGRSFVCDLAQNILSWTSDSLRILVLLVYLVSKYGDQIVEFLISPHTTPDGRAPLQIGFNPDQCDAPSALIRHFVMRNLSEFVNLTKKTFFSTIAMLSQIPDINK
jgi:hypothetical protein